MTKKSIFLLNLIFLTALVSISISCKKQSVNQEEPKYSRSEKISYTQKGYIADEKTIAQQAEELLNIVDKNLFRTSTRKIKNITPIYPSSFRSGDSAVNTQPSVYVVNFSDNQGYAVLSADSRLNPVWALSHTGNLDVNKTPDNPTFVTLMKQVEASFNLNNWNVSDSLYVSGFDGWGNRIPKPLPRVRPFHVEFGPWEEIEGSRHESALVPVVWGQSDEPYSRFLDTAVSKHAGCVTAAVAQIMAFHRFPNRYNWSEMLKHHSLSKPDSAYTPAYNEIGRLYSELGLALKVKYGKDGSYAYDEDVPKVFMKFGYKSGGHLQSYSFDSLYDEVVKQNNGKGYPVYFSAVDKYKIKEHRFLWIFHWQEVESKGHAFIVDGVCKARRLVTVIDDDTNTVRKQYYQTINLLHANIGWDNINRNGYYSDKVFDLSENGGCILKCSSNTYTIGKDLVYIYDFDMITGIRP